MRRTVIPKGKAVLELAGASLVFLLLVSFARADEPTAGQVDREPILDEDGEDSWGVDFNFRLSNRLNVKENFLDTSQGISIGQYGPAGKLLWSIKNPMNLRFDQDAIGYSLFAAGSVDVHYGSWFGASLAVDTGEMIFPPLVKYTPSLQCQLNDPRCGVTSNGQPIGDEAKQSYFIREVYIESGLGTDWLQLRAGKQLVSAGGSFLMNNYALGLVTTGDLDQGFDLPLKVAVNALLPNGDFTSSGKRSPLASLDVSYFFSLFDELGLFFSYYHDGDNSIAGILRPTIMEWAWHDPRFLNVPPKALNAAANLAVVETHGDLFYFGLHGNLIFARASLSAVAILEFGSFDFSLNLPKVTLPNGDVFNGLSLSGTPSCLGGMAQASFHYDVTDFLTLGAFMLFLSGETFSTGTIKSESNNHYQSFIGIYPYITLTNIFFQGGMNQTFSARSLSASGVNGRGVIAPGLTAGWEITPDMTLRYVSAALFSQGANLESGGRFYGWENDLNFQWNILKYLQILVEADYLWTGDFFDFQKPLEDPATRAFVAEPDAWKILVGLDVVF